ncbi:hypothetical protein PQE75_gp014 [Bacillus phage vB_BcoS-136]|uniref:Uncharacterized protein n=1 Tax=Bacillus phage vB_BcoS-136 TaxID=2419619 RepID=A0A3G3BVR5_9CAUD|nr:hypothetical protein PQE75_gp014 [Bacillus phage vB_BcoS-136]AYP68146.1 hypothetical protein vBBcoS136_00014 [Bacillus phage vB_BcoS-136]
MGWSIQTNNMDEWSVFSSVTDSVIAKFETEHDLKVWLANDRVYEGKLKAIEILMSFPNHWNVNGERKRIANGYYEWVRSLDNIDTYEEYHLKIDEKLDKLINNKI